MTIDHLVAFGLGLTIGWALTSAAWYVILRAVAARAVERMKDEIIGRHVEPL